MGTRTLVTEEEYLRMSFDGREPEYVDGDLVERSLPNNSHSKAQLEVGFLFRKLQERVPLYGRPELRVRVAPRKFRIVDVAVYAHNEPSDELPAKAPYIAIEIVSPDDKYEDLMTRLEEYRNWGVPNVWLVDPGLNRIYVHRDGALTPVPAFLVPEFDVQIRREDILR